MDNTEKGYVLSADWTHAVQERLAVTSNGKTKIKMIDAFGLFSYLCRILDN